MTVFLPAHPKNGMSLRAAAAPGAGRRQRLHDIVAWNVSAFNEKNLSSGLQLLEVLRVEIRGPGG